MKSRLEGVSWEARGPSRDFCRAPVREDEGWARA